MLASYNLKSTDKRVVPKMQIAAKQEYRWRLEQKGAFRLIGKSIHVSRRNGQHYTKILGFWGECQKDSSFSLLASKDTGVPKGLFGLFLCDEKTTDEMEYSIMVKSDAELPDGCIEIKCPELEWYSDGNAYAVDYLSQIWILVIDS